MNELNTAMEPYQIIKYLANDCTEAEKDRVMQWINASSDNRAQFENLKKIWEASLHAPDAITPDFSKAWKNISRKTGMEHSKNPTPQISIYTSRVMKIAASILVIATMGFVLAHWMFSKPVMLTKTNKSLSKMEIRLADGTEVCLNRNSSVVFPEKFYGKNREITMEGEAYFKVARDENHPFIVSANGTFIRVLGTSFNIKISGSEKIVVSVLSGKVAFQSADNPSIGVQLEKGELGIFDKNKAVVKKESFTDENFISWETGILQFENKPLVEVAHVLSEYFSTNIEVNALLQHRQITVSFNNLSLSEVLDILKITLDIHITQSSGRIQFNP